VASLLASQSSVFFPAAFPPRGLGCSSENLEQVPRSYFVGLASEFLSPLIEVPMLNENNTLLNTLKETAKASAVDPLKLNILTGCFFNP